MSKLAEIQQKLKVPKNQYNNFGKYKYRSCEDIVEAVKPLLQGASLTLSDEIVLIGDRYYIKATATLEENEKSWSKHGWAREPENKKGMDESQITGAASSYARKYALNGLFAIDDEKDADTKSPTDNEPIKNKSEIKLPLKAECYRILKSLKLDEPTYNLWDEKIRETNSEQILLAIKDALNKLKK